MVLGVGVNGAAGRMGRRLIALIAEADDLRLAGAVEREGSAALGQDAGELANFLDTDAVVARISLRLQVNDVESQRVFVDDPVNAAVAGPAKMLARTASAISHA